MVTSLSTLWSGWRGGRVLDRRQKVLLAVSVAIVGFFATGNFVATRLESKAPFQPLAIFGQVVSYVSGDYVEEVDEKEAMEGAIAGFLEGLDPMCDYLESDEVAAYNQTAAAIEKLPFALSKRYGYGVVLQVEAGSAIETAGLKRGDYVRALDRISTRDMGLYHIYAAMLSKPTCELAIVRESWRADPITLTLKKTDLVAGAPASVATGKDGTTVVEFRWIRKGAAAVMQRALRASKSAPESPLVLDLRGCGGNDFKEAIEIVSTVVKGGEVARRKGRAYKEEVFSSAESSFIVAPRLAVLVSSSTTGAAEIVAASLKFRGAARIFGGRTYGLAREQQLFRMSGGGGLILSIYDWASPDGKVVTGKGVDPDVVQEAEGTGSGGSADPVMDAAIDYLLVD